MKTRIALLLVAAVVAAYLAGSAGTANAGAALTAKSVKKIAAKVVTKSAPKLSVAHAKTADSATSAANADKLDNLDSSDLKTTAYTFTIPGGPAALSHVYSLPGLPSGTYAATYTVSIDITSPATCEIVPSLASAPGAVVGKAYSSAAVTFSSITGAATFAPGVQPAFRCTSAASFTITESAITLTRVDTLVAGTAGTFS